MTRGSCALSLIFNIKFEFLTKVVGSLGWLLSAYFLGGFGEDGKGKNGLFKAFIAATKSWSLGIPVSPLYILGDWIL